MHALFKGLVSAVVVWLAQRYRRLSLDLLRIEATLGYVRGVRLARSAFLAALALLLYLLLLGTGFVVFHIGLFMLLPAGWVKACVLMGLGLAYMLVPALLIRRRCSEKTWMEWTRATDLTDAATRPR